MEVPLSTIEFAGSRWPIGGGGYFRLMPGALTRAAMRSIEKEGRSAVLYFHPYELDAAEMGELRRDGWQIPRRVGVTQSLFRGRVEPRLRKLLSSFAVSPIGDAIRSV